MAVTITFPKDELLALAMEAIENGEDDAGFCVNCGERRDGWTEPDAREYPCEACGTNTVYGAQELLLMLVP